jgi:undecaprenyl-diphosphatase
MPLNHKRYFGKATLSVLLLLLPFIAAIWLFSHLMHEVLLEQEVAIDNNILTYIGAHWISPPLTRFMKAVTFCASASFLQVAFAAVMLICFVRKQTRRAFEVLAIGLGGFLLNYYMKIAFHRVRPPHPLMPQLLNFSFPSGHATSGFIFYGLLSYLIWKTTIPRGYKTAAAILLISFSLLIGFSRVYLRMHYPSDVAAGFCVGFAWLILTIWIMEKLRARSARRRAAGTDKILQHRQLTPPAS